MLESAQVYNPMSSCYLGLLLLCASTLMYEVILTRLLSVVSWYYHALVSVSMAIFGMTAGALFVQVREDLFTEGLIRRRAFQATRAAATSMPLVLLTMLAIPLDLSRSLQTAYSFFVFDRDQCSVLAIQRRSVKRSHGQHFSPYGPRAPSIAARTSWLRYGIRFRKFVCISRGRELLLCGCPALECPRSNRKKSN